MTDAHMTKLSKYRALRERFAAELPGRLDEIAQSWKVYQGSAPGANPEELQRAAHSLAGAAGSFGFHALGQQARVLENDLRQLDGHVMDRLVVAGIEQAIGELYALAARGPDLAAEADPTAVAEPKAPAPGEGQSLVYVLEDDATVAMEMARQIEHFGYRAQVFADSAALKVAVAGQRPDVLLADIHLREGEQAGPEVVAELKRRIMPPIPVAFVSGSDRWRDRLSAVRAGGQAYLSKPLNVSLLIEQLDTITGKQHDAPYRILIVDDTPLLAEHYATVLESAGMTSRILHDPTSLLEVLPAFRPDLVLMDVYMPECSGIEAAQVIRQHTGYTNLPIVYLSSETDLQQQLGALRVGGDDFLQKPISDGHLAAAVRIRAKRFRELSALMTRDGLTGLVNHINLKLALEREIAQTRRRGGVFSFVMIDLDRFKSVNDTYGHPVGDRVIKALARLLSQRLRKGDIAGRYGGEEFALILPDTQLANTRMLLDGLREQFARISHQHDTGELTATFSAGIATSPPHTEMGAIIAAADAALYDAKRQGRNRVVADRSL